MTVPVATKHEKRPSAWSFLLQHVAALFKGAHFTSNRPNGISGPDHLCDGDVATVTICGAPQVTLIRWKSRIQDMHRLPHKVEVVGGQQLTHLRFRQASFVAVCVDNIDAFQ